jgi:branched-chain amino acid aminotransferase
MIQENFMTSFGTVFTPEMILTHFDGVSWSTPELVPSERISIHPAAHVLHYASTCFEGLKAFRHADGGVKIFRLDTSIARMQQSSKKMSLPEIDPELTRQMVIDIVRRFSTAVPKPPGSMYIRPTHMGTEPAIGKAAVASMTSTFFVLLSPVGAYFSVDSSALRLLLEVDKVRCAPHMGMVKTGGNYASALGLITAAKQTSQADQVLFCPDGDVQETGAANFILIDGNEIITKALDHTFLHGITRDSVLTLARDLGMNISERTLSVVELIERVTKPNAEAALSGTAAVLAPVGTLIYQGQEITVGAGNEGPITRKLRQALNAIQWGETFDSYGWLTTI